MEVIEIVFMMFMMVLFLCLSIYYVYSDRKDIKIMRMAFEEMKEKLEWIQEEIQANKLKDDDIRWKKKT